jgi:hypothetical protein
MRLFQKLFPQPTPPTPDEIQQRVMEALGFKKDDLKENYYGRMSSHQHYWFIDKWLRRTIIYFGGAILLGAALYHFGRNPVGGSVDVVWVFIMLVAVVGVTLSGMIIFRDMLIDLVRRKVERISGLGKLKLHHHRNSRTYSLYIEDERFPISKEIYNALVDNEHYTVYYAPRSKVIVAIEVD